MTGSGTVDGPGHRGHPDGGVDGVVHRLPPIAPAHHPQADQVGPMRLQPVIGEEAAGRKIGHEQPGLVTRRGDDAHRQLAPLGPRQVDGDGFLALVQPLPIQAVAAVRGKRPAVEIGAAADLVDADDARRRAAPGAARRTGAAMNEAASTTRIRPAVDTFTRSSASLPDAGAPRPRQQAGASQA